jgi:hypothetical protein
MSQRVIHAKEVLKDMRAGLDENALMQKYRLSPKGLERLFSELVDAGYLEQVDQQYVFPSRRRISTKQLIADVRAGMSNQELMGKYKLTAIGLENAFKQLVETKSINPDELFGPPTLRHDAVLPQGIRELERYYLDFELPVIDTGPPEIDGKVRDITEKGLGVVGIPSEIGDVKTLLILHEEFVVIEPFLFEAQCRWVRKSPQDGEVTAGFLITRIADEDHKQLKQLIELVTFRG